jgi:multidrug transporter EmrE-like cation transporter
MPYILLVINVFIMASGQLFFKRSADFINANPNLRFPNYYIVNPWFYIAISLFVISTFVWTQALTKIPLSLAYPIVSSAYILTLFGASFFFHEHISFLSVLGVLLIMSGISLTVIR